MRLSVHCSEYTYCSSSHSFMTVSNHTTCIACMVFFCITKSVFARDEVVLTESWLALMTTVYGGLGKGLLIDGVSGS